MLCWKCSKEIPFGVECDECQTGGVRFIRGQELKGEWLEIDWTKIVSFEDLKVIFSVLHIKIKKDEKDLVYQRMKKYLRK